LPLLLACALAFQNEILRLPPQKEQWILWGTLAYVLCHFFLYTFKDVYNYGHQMTSQLCQFFQPLGNIAGFIFPIYTVLVICLGLIINLMGFMPQYESWVVFMLAFTMTMHIVLSANQLYEADSHPIKGQYFSTFTFAFIFQVILVSLLLWTVIPEFSFVKFINAMAHLASGYYKWIYKVIF